MKGLKETVFNVYASKRRSEVAPGVGKDTDLIIITDEGIKHLDPRILEQLDEIYQEFEKPISKDIRDKVQNFSWEEEVSHDSGN